MISCHVFVNTDRIDYVFMLVMLVILVVSYILLCGLDCDIVVIVVNYVTCHER